MTFRFGLLPAFVLLSGTCALADLDPACRENPTPACLLTEAATLIATFQPVISTAPLFAELSKAQSSAGMTAEADQSLGLAVDQLQANADSLTDNYAVTTVAARMAELGRIPEAIALANRITRPADRDFAIGAIARAQVTGGDMTAAEITLAQIGVADSLGSALADIVGVQIAAGDLSAAIKTAARITDPFHTAVSQIRIAGAQAENGDLAQAFATAFALPDPVDQTKARIAIARGLAQAGQSQAAETILAEVQALLPTLPSQGARNGTQRQLFAAYLATGQIEAAQQLGPVGETDGSRIGFFMDIAGAQADQGQFDAAMATAQAANDPMLPMFVRMDIAVAQLEQGLTRDAMASYDLIDTDQRRARVLLRMAAALSDP